jgi:ribosome production factor 2
MKPVIVFQGEPFEMNNIYARLKNLLIDFFKLSEASELNIAELARVIVVTCKDEKSPIHFQHIEVEAPIDEEKVRKNGISFKEIGPCFNMHMRRNKIAANDLYKEACKKPKVLNVEKKKQDKNKFTDNIGNVKGKVYLQHQDLNTIALKKIRKKDIVARPEDI